MVALEPGRITSAASAGQWAGRAARRISSMPGSAEGVEVVEIGDAGQQRHRDAGLARGVRGRASSRSCASSAGRRRASSGKKGTRPRGPSRCGGRSAMPSAKRGGRRACLLTMKPWIIARIGLEHHRMRADEAGDHAAAVDIPDQHHRHVGRAGKAHIGDVAGAQVDLAGAAGAFDQHDVGLARASGQSCAARPAAGWASSRWYSRARRCPACGPARPPARRSLCGFSSTGFMCTLAARARRAPAAPARGRSRRHRP
jgi:hypothetical protein